MKHDNIAHSPGPFTVSFEQESVDSKRWMVVHGGGTPYLIATIENGVPGDTLMSEEANARLFAAAPELLSALKAEVRECGCEELKRDCRRLSCAKSRAAIAKAEVRSCLVWHLHPVAVPRSTEERLRAIVAAVREAFEELLR